VVCADDDRQTPGNPGVTHARAAAAAVGGVVLVPRFRRPGPGDTDFNDLARREGLAAVRSQLEQANRAAAVRLGLSVICAERLPPEPIAWLWEGWLARGKVHLLAGAPGTGKTSVALALAAILSTAGRWPDGSAAPAGPVLIWSGEDDPRDTLVPRLLACGADLARIHFVGSVTAEDGIRAFDPARDADLLREEAAAMDPPPALLIVDPIVSAVTGDSHKNAEVRRGLQPLVDLAAVVRCVVLGVSHFTKGTVGRDPVERVTGSLAFAALARVVLATARLPAEEGGRRVLARAKNNLGLDTGGFAYDLEPLGLVAHPGIHTTRVCWGAALEGSARDLLGKAESIEDPEERSALEDAKAWLGHTLSFGALDGKELKRLARVEGIPERTLYRAASALGVERTAHGFGKARLWSMCAKTPMSAKEKALAELGTPGTAVPVSARDCQPPTLGTHEPFGTHEADGKPVAEDF
jgi:putative DNA primase/helicase